VPISQESGINDWPPPFTFHCPMCIILSIFFWDVSYNGTERPFKEIELLKHRSEDILGRVSAHNISAPTTPGSAMSHLRIEMTHSLSAWLFF
jgi:hypothetical protein